MDKAAFELLEQLTAATLRGLRRQRLRATDRRTGDELTEEIDELDRHWNLASDEQKGSAA